MKISKNWLLVALVASALAFVGTRVRADDAVDIQGYPNYNSVVYNGSGDDAFGGNDADATVEAILSQPGTFGGHSYTYWEVLITDASGGIETDFSSTSLSGLGWTPAVGQNVSVSATWNPYHSVPELVTATAATVGPNATPFTAVGVQGNQIDGMYAQATTIPSAIANNGYNKYLPISQGLEGYIVEIPNVTILGQGALTIFPTTNETMYINDTAGNSMTMYYWYTSYSCDGQLEGSTIPTGAVNVFGFLSSYPSVSAGITTWQDELVPTAFVAVPEPSSLMLAGIGLLSLLAVIRRRHS